jgi:hypothetical protein
MEKTLKRLFISKRNPTYENVYRPKKGFRGGLSVATGEAVLSK